MAMRRDKLIEFSLGMILSGLMLVAALVGYGSGQYSGESMLVFLVMMLPLTSLPMLYAFRR